MTASTSPTGGGLHSNPGDGPPPTLPQHTPATGADPTPSANAWVPTPREELQGIIDAEIRAGVLRAFVTLEGPQHLANGPLPAAELARCCSADVSSMGRLVRALRGYRFLTLDDFGHVQLNDVGRLLIPGEEGSMTAALAATASMTWQQILHARSDLGQAPTAPTQRTSTISMGATPAAEGRPSPREEFQSVLDGEARLKLLRAFVAFEGPQHLADGPLPVADLARCCSADVSTMSQLVRALHGGPILTLDDDAHVQLTVVGRLLIPGEEGAMTAALEVTTSPTWQHMLHELPNTLRSGRPHFPDGATSLYTYLQQDPMLEERFSRFMSERSALVAQALARHDYSGVQTIVDLGGGIGAILATILEKYPHLTGVLVELPSVAKQAQQYLTQRKLSDRCIVIDGDMFSISAPGAQRVILSQILHNWSNEACIQLLRVVCAALEEAGQGSELWCIDGVLPPEGDYNPVIDRDMRMLAMFGRDGRERSVDEFAALMHDAGLTLLDSRCMRLPDNQTLLVARSAGQ